MKGMEAFDKGGVGRASLGLFKMRQDDDCVNDLSPSCADDEDNLMASDDNILQQVHHRRI